MKQRRRSGKDISPYDCRVKISDEEGDDIFNSWMWAGVTQVRLAAHYEANQSTISRICNKKLEEWVRQMASRPR